MSRLILTRIFLCAIASVVLYACTEQRSGSIGVPLPKAYPRVALYDTIYRDAGLPLGFQVNTGAVISNAKQHESKSENQWIDITYPAYGLTLHCTFIPVDESTRAQVTANRLERMSLNIGDSYAEQTDLTSTNGCSTVIINTLGRTLTPLQFLSIGEKWIVSGAAKFVADSVTPDSVHPLIEAVKTDIIHAAKSLR